jgi:hypothetical protein
VVKLERLIFLKPRNASHGTAKLLESKEWATLAHLVERLIRDFGIQPYATVGQTIGIFAVAGAN